ncbi:MAG: tetratricopeptide repeat protein, partial [Gammaproteobacteria bacterium]|nr:tetratricopeptide repeat protein [Gammaproteobacteria bacterium]
APVSEVDRLFGEYKVGLIKSNWPFTESPSRPRLPVADSVPAMLAQQLYRQQTDWASAHSQLAQFYQNNGQRDRYLQTVLILADAFPFRSRLQFDAGVALIEAGRHRQALNYLYRAGQQAPRDINVLLALSHALILNRAHDTAREVLQRVLILDPGNMTATKALRQLEAVSN